MIGMMSFQGFCMRIYELLFPADLADLADCSKETVINKAIVY